mmetsp:Transcript_20058/g.26050  ORF Transcript_20058/g.26050 Transcript_20058/m.26050 type:complete len:977 (+) Transcript_20058:239-3169(+)
MAAKSILNKKTVHKQEVVTRADTSSEGPPPERKTVDFKDRTIDERGRQEDLIDKDAARLKYGMGAKPPPGESEKAYKTWKAKWEKFRKMYQKSVKVEEDEILADLVEAMSSNSLERPDLMFIFNKFRKLRNLLVRIIHTNTVRLVRVYMAADIEMVLEIFKVIDLDIRFCDNVEKDDYHIGGITDRDKREILDHLEVGDDVRDKWIQYMLFLTNPATEWSRLKSRFEKFYLKLFNTAVVQCVVNNKIRETKQLIAYKLPNIIKGSIEYNLTAIQRADRHFSSYKRNSCPKTCQGHRGKLLLLVIRQNYLNMVKLVLQQGVNATSQCCSGNIKTLYWGKDNARDDDDSDNSDDSDADSEDGEDDGSAFSDEEEHDEYGTLKAEFEYVTPLSRAAESSSREIVRVLIDDFGANPLQCHDVAIRSCVKTVIDRAKYKEKELDDNPFLMNQMQDDQFIFNYMVDKSQRSLLDKQRVKNIRVPPNYCTVALLYQAVINQMWEAETVLTTPFTVVGDSRNPYTKVLQGYGLGGANQEFIGRKKSRKRSGRKNSRKSQIQNTELQLKYKEQMSADPVRRIGRKKSLFGQKEANPKIARKKSFNSKLDVDLCYVLVRVIDKLLADLFRPNTVTHGRHINGVVTLLERHQLYLNEDRFKVLLKAAVVALENVRPGDIPAVKRLFENKQFRDFLNWDKDPHWQTRQITRFIKDVKILSLLGIKKNGKVTSKYVAAEETVATMLEDIAVLAGRVDLPTLITDMDKYNVKLKEDVKLQMMASAALEENLASIEAIAKAFGAYLLEEAFEHVQKYSLLFTLQKILELDCELARNEEYIMDEWLAVLLTDSHADPYVLKTTIDFYFRGIVLKPEKIDFLLKRCFTGQRGIGYKAMGYFLGKSTIVYPDLIDVELVEEYLRGKEYQYDRQAKTEQDYWIVLLNSLLDHITDEHEREELDDKVRHMLGDARRRGRNSLASRRVEDEGESDFL